MRGSKPGCPERTDERARGNLTTSPRVGYLPCYHSPESRSTGVVIWLSQGAWIPDRSICIAESWSGRNRGAVLTRELRACAQPTPLHCVPPTRTYGPDLGGLRFRHIGRAPLLPTTEWHCGLPPPKPGTVQGETGCFVHPTSLQRERSTTRVQGTPRGSEHLSVDTIPTALPKYDRRPICIAGRA